MVVIPKKALTPRACAHREEVVQPNDKRQYGNTDGRPKPASA